MQTKSFVLSVDDRDPKKRFHSVSHVVAAIEWLEWSKYGIENRQTCSESIKVALDVGG